MTHLQTVFFQLAAKFSDDENLKTALWAGLEKHYSSRKRHYHNLTHLENMIAELGEVRKQIGNFDVILFSVFFHDVIYKAISADNEEKSAAFAVSWLRKLSVENHFIDAVAAQILATKKHEKSADRDTNYLLDADLAVLGKDWETYRLYATQIRKEYAVYPDFMYKPGRKKVLLHFLTFPEIYKTDEFKSKYELQARKNLAMETESL